MNLDGKQDTECKLTEKEDRENESQEDGQIYNKREKYFHNTLDNFEKGLNSVVTGIIHKHNEN